MSDAPSKPDYRHTVFLPKTDFPMKAGLPQKEPAILAKWQEQDLYAQVRKARDGREKFILHDGPPYANGDIHIGHALNHILKDMVVRTQTLLGKDAPYVPGWDCHGLPIEWKVEEQYRKKKLNKDEVPVREFRAECRAYAQGWVDTQREQLKRLGIGGRWDKPYLTMNFAAEGTIVAELMKFAESGQLYRGAKPVMWSPVEKTALAEAEIEYEDIVSTQIDVAFEIVEAPVARDIATMIERGGRVLAVIWTTTPWTIPVNQALAYNPAFTYRMVRLGLDWNPAFSGKWPETALHRRLHEFGWRIHNDAYLVAAELTDAFVARVNAAIAMIDFSDLTEHPVQLMSVADHSVSGGEIVDFDGLDLAGTIARHPMHKLGGFFAKPRPFLPGDFVTTDTGTGLVHMAPDHGEDDFDLCKRAQSLGWKENIDPVFAVEADGKDREDWAWLGGQGSVINNKFNAPDGPICSDLREAGALLAASEFRHSYPHSWRSKAKVIYRCTPQWFIGMDKPLAPLLMRERGGPAAQQWEGEGLSESPSAADAAGPSSRPSPSRGEGAYQRWENEGGHLAEGPTLRQLAERAIAATRFVPDKGRNRIGSMVEGRPDWVISRQRAWGVPIALFVKRGTNQPLVEPEVNARIVAAIKAEGVDAWSDERAQDYLGPNHDAADYERVADILDVWFDSGCTHAFTLESGTWPELSWPADLYLEGSDQHRGWFQSSLLESCGTRGRAPYKTVLTHGFTMDSKGMKMSKSLGNTISPIDLMKEHGADILRLWALSVDFTEDHRIGKEILSGVADQYRKLRNTFRYLLGALEGYSDAEKLGVEEMPELERYMLALLADLDAKLRQAVADYDFNSYTRLIAEFANNDLSAFYFDIRKDCLYCDAPSDPKRRAYRTVLDTLFHALVRWCAPVLVFTAEEVWGTRFPEGGSVHLLEWPELFPGEGRGPGRCDSSADALLDPGLRRETEKWQALREIRYFVTGNIEPMRREKKLGSSLEAAVTLGVPAQFEDVVASADLAELFISSHVELRRSDSLSATIERTRNHKCGRCWRHLPEVEEDGDLCNRCDGVVNA
ncbi:MAG: isoleucine--tRNA ligase [Sphingomicrobium sp.]